MSELQTNNFHRVLTLQDDISIFSASLTIDNLEPLRVGRNMEYSDPDDHLPHVPISVDFRYELRTEESEMAPIANRQIASAWGDEVFELLDLSICLVHLSQREDTTEKLADLMAPPREGTDSDPRAGNKRPRKPYTHTVQWMMLQDFLGCGVRMMSVKDKHDHSRRFVYFDLYAEYYNSYANAGLAAFETSVLLEPSSEALLTFAAQLRQCYDDLHDVIWLG